MPINPDEAPDGYIAVPFNSCDHCEVVHNSELCRDAACTAFSRNDKGNCMFKEKPPSHSECLALDALVNHRGRPLTEADLEKLEERIDELERVVFHV